MDKIVAIRDEFQGDLKKASTSIDLENIKVKYLGRKGPLQGLMKTLRDVSAEMRPKFGKAINDLKVEISNCIEEKFEELFSVEEELKIESETLDITLPGRRKFSGQKHILTKTLHSMLDVLIGMGFSVQYGPEIETDYYNFATLNFPPDHPARDMQDTFYIAEDLMLRTHTSNIQARVMENNKPPIRIIAPGKSYRNEEITARSHVFFQQIEAFYVDKGVVFGDLLVTMDEFLQKIFGEKVETRYRPSYFPFVEPGMEVDVCCISCKGKGCQLCKHTGWLEICGAGMVHPEVLKMGNIDPEIYTGFAWGMGVERLAMLKYNISDIRLFTENRLSFLNQFAAV